MWQTGMIHVYGISMIHLDCVTDAPEEPQYQCEIVWCYRLALQNDLQEKESLALKELIIRWLLRGNILLLGVELVSST